MDIFHKINVNARKPASYRYDEKLPPQSAMLEELLKEADIQQLFEAFYNLNNIPVAIIDLNANVLFSSRWQRICTLYHRVHPMTCERCIESDTQLASQTRKGKGYAIYSCRNGLTDCAAPIFIEGKQVANVFIGQFLTKPPDEDWFRRQAEEFGFDVADYLAALREVPIVRADKIPAILDLLTRMTRLITNLAVDRKRAVESQARQGAILNSIPQAVFWKDIDGKYLGCNTAFAKTAGLASPDDVVGKTDFDLPWPREEAEAYRADDQAVISSNQARRHIIEPAQTADGARIVVDTSKIPLTDTSNIPYGLVGVYDDITERIRAEEALRESEEKYRMLVEGTNDIIYSIAADGVLTYISPQVSRYGWAPEELISKSILIPVHEEDRERISREFEETIRFGKEMVSEFRIRTKAGEVVWFSDNGKVLRDAQGNIQGSTGVLTNITERIRADEALRESESRFRILSDSAIVGVDIIQDNRFIYVNPAFAAVFGYQPGELIGANPMVVIHPDDQALVAGQIKRRVSGEQPTMHYEFRGMRKDGETRHIEVFSIRIVLNQRPALVANLLDITERKQAQARILKLSQLYAVLSQTNTTIVHSTNQEELFRNLCKGAVEQGKFRLAWVGLVDEGTQRVQPVCHAGAEQGYLTDIYVSADDIPEGRGPTGAAIRENRVCYINNFSSDERMKPWLEPASRLGIQSAVGLPLRLKGKVIGALTMYAGEAELFDAEQLALMDEMSANISFALDGLAREAERREAENNLAESQALLNSIFDSTSDLVWSVEPSSFGLLSFNRRIYDYFMRNRGVSLKKGMRPADMLPLKQFVETWEGLYRRVLKEGSYDTEYEGIAGPIILQLKLNVLKRDGAVYAISVFGEDITERKHAEQRIAEYVKRLEGTMKNTLQAVANMVEMRDPYTAGHERRVGLIASKIAQEMGWPVEKCYSLELIGLVHDIGKIAVPTEILTKPGRLTPVEYQIVQAHSERGYEILKDVDFPLPIAEIIYQHHERMDGSGYPRGLKGDEILPEARILAVADVLESMASHRPYRPALGIEAALKEIKDHRGAWFDAQVVDAMFKLIREKGYQLPE